MRNTIPVSAEVHREFLKADYGIDSFESDDTSLVVHLTYEGDEHMQLRIAYEQFATHDDLMGILLERAKSLRSQEGPYHFSRRKKLVA